MGYLLVRTQATVETVLSFSPICVLVVIKTDGLINYKHDTKLHRDRPKVKMQYITLGIK